MRPATSQEKDRLKWGMTPEVKKTNKKAKVKDTLKWGMTPATLGCPTLIFIFFLIKYKIIFK
jgi:hypothetical protein